MKTLQKVLWTSAALVGFALVFTPAPASADICHLDDVIIDGSLCVGFDCVCNMSFGFDTIVLQENNLRIFFNDTSSSASFPTTNWRIRINDSSNGGSGYFAVEDADTGRTPFRIEAGSIENALYVDSSGDVGIGTSTPVVELHAVDGNTPTLRLEQNGSSGFTPQTWDVAGNETNFFVRDATNGSRLPFRIRPSAPSNSIYVENNGDVGLGTASPEADSTIHALRSGNLLPKFESSGSGAIQLTLQTDSTNRRIVARGADGVAESQLEMRDAGTFQFVAETITDGVCLQFRDSDDAGDTMCTTLNGAMVCAIGTCP